MAITMSLYQINEDFKTVGKTIPTATSTHTIKLKDGCSIDNPTVSFSAQASAIAPLNYAYIDTFGRYYFIRDRKSLVNGILELTLESDPWESFRAELLNVEATINRSAKSSLVNGFLMDSGYQLLAYKHCAIRNFPVGIDDDTMILTTVG